MRSHTLTASAVLAVTLFGQALAQDAPPSDMLGGSEGLEIPEDVSHK